jgi:hypothetical protein
MDDMVPLINERDVLSKLYSLIDVVGQMNTSSKREVINLLADSTCIKLTIVLEVTRKNADILEDKIKGKGRDKVKENLKANYKAGLKAIVYFVSCVLEDVWIKSEDTNKIFKEDKKGKKKQKKTRKRQLTEGKEGFEDSGDDEGLNFERLLEELARMAERRVACIWKEHIDEESYLKLYVKIVFLMLEQAEIVASLECKKMLKQTLKATIHSTKIDCKGLFQLISGQMVHLLYSIVSLIE